MNSPLRVSRKPVIIIIVSFTLLLTPAITSSGFDWDWGATVDNSTILGSNPVSDEMSTRQLLKVGLWATALRQLADGASVGFAGMGSYALTDERAYIFDVDLLRFTGRFPGALGPRSILQTTAGRTRFADPTGLVLDHTADGGIARVQYPGVGIRIGTAYTGLLLSPSSSIRISSADYFEASSDQEFFGPRRLIGLTELRYGSLELFTLAQFDLRDEASGATVDTQYFGVSGTAAIGRSLYSDTFLILSTGQSHTETATDSLFSFAGGTGVRFFAEELRFSRASLRALYASPFLPLEEDIGVNVTEFKAITEPTLGLAFSPRLSNLILTELEYSLRPFAGPRRAGADTLRVNVTGRGFFRGYIGDSDYIAKLDPDSDSLYLGTEVELGVGARVFSDLGLSLRAAVFLPGSGELGAFSGERTVDWALRADLSTGF